MALAQSGGGNARGGARSHHRRADAGQATVELALALPLVFAMVALLFQIAVVARDEILVTHVARDAARTAAVSADAARVAAAVHETLPDAEVHVVRRGRVGEPVEVTISYVARTNLPLIGMFVPDLTLHGRSVMRVERP